MSLRTISFNDMDSVGLTRSVKGSSSIDIMSFSGKSSNMFNFNALASGNGVSDPIYGQQQTIAQSLLQGDTRQQSFMGMLHPDKGFNAVKFNVSENTLNANMDVKNGGEVASRTSGMKQENHDTRGALQEQHRKDMAQATDALKDSALANGHSVGAAKSTFLASSEPDKMAAALYIAGSLAFGGPLVNAVGQVGFFKVELSKAEKKLSLDEQEKICKAQLDTLQSGCNVPQDTRLTAASKPVQTSTNDAHWENFNEKNLKEFMATRFENLEEVKQLDQVDNDIDTAQENLSYIAVNGEVPEIDSVDVALAGEALRGIETIRVPQIASNDASFDNVVDISSKMAAQDLLPQKLEPNVGLQYEMRHALG